MDHFELSGSNDDELYRRFREGEVSAIEELMKRYGDSLTIFINGYLHNMQDAEDMTVEAFARIVLKKPAIRMGGFKAYLFKIARNLAARHHMLSTRIETFSIDEMEEEILHQDDAEDYEESFGHPTRSYEERDVFDDFLEEEEELESSDE